MSLRKRGMEVTITYPEKAESAISHALLSAEAEIMDTLKNEGGPEILNISVDFTYFKVRQTEIGWLTES